MNERGEEQKAQLPPSPSASFFSTKKTARQTAETDQYLL